MKLKTSVLAVLLFAYGTGIDAAEWSRAIAPELRPAYVFDVVANGDGYVLARPDDGSWVRVDSRGEASLDPRARSVRADFGNAVVPLAPGKLLVETGYSGVGCQQHWVDDLGTLLAVGGFSAACENDLPLALDAASGVWFGHVDNQHWARLQQDGRVKLLTGPIDAINYNAAFSSSPVEAAAYSTYQSATGPKLVKMTPDGVAWTLAPPQVDVRFRQALSLRDGDVLVLGQQGTGGSNDRVWLARYAPGGTLRWQRSHAALSAGLLFSPPPRVLAGGGVAIAVLPSLESAPKLHLFDARGELVRTLTTLGQERFLDFVSGPSGDPRMAPRELAYFVGVRPAGALVDSVTAIEHVDANGRRIARHRSNDYSSAALLSDGSLVHAFAGDGPGLDLQHFAADGSLRATPDLDQLRPAARKVLLGAVASNGDSFSLSYVDYEPLQLRAFDRDGGLRWQRTLDAAMESFGGEDVSLDGRETDHQARLASNAERVCFGPTYQFIPIALGFGHLDETSLVHCLRRSDGALLYWLPASPTSRDTYLPEIEVRETGEVVLAKSSCDAAGACAQNRVVVSPSGDATRVEPLGEGLVVTDVQGAITALRPDPSLPRLLDAQARSGGDYVLHSRPERHRLHGADRIGRVLWTREFDVGTSNLPSDHAPFLYTTSGNYVLVATQQAVEGRVHSAIEVLDAATGNTRWRQTKRLQPGRGVRTLNIDPTRGAALVVRDGPAEPVLTLYALESGAEIGRRILDCPSGSGCSPTNLAFDSDRTLRRFGGGVDAARLELDSTLEPARVGQPALLGTWYAPGTTGQGLQIDYNHTRGAMQAGWFTYDLADVGDARGLRWFTLGGETVPGAKDVALTIYYNEGGRFAMPPITRASVIGNARLSLRTCNEAVLTYHFENGALAGLDGELSLRRLTPSLFDCVNESGAIEPGAGIDGTAGLDAAHSGAWYAPESSGQGLLFDLRPPNGDDPGHLVGGWFTYDLGGQTDDPSAQHWFLIDGPLQQARAGMVTVPIYRAAGGRFDLSATRNVHRVGEAQLHFAGCSTARLEYRFDTTDLAAEFAGRRGQIALQKLLPCQR